MNARIEIRILFFLGALLVFTAAANAVPKLKTLEYPYAVEGKVVSVSGGDTVTLLSGKSYYKMRLAGIAAPLPRQAYGRAAKAQLSRLVLKKEVTVTVIGRIGDRWYVGEVFRKGTDVNAAMVRAGLARRSGQGPYVTRLAEAEKEARQKHLGLWRNEKRVTEPQPSDKKATKLSAFTNPQLN